MRSPGRTRDDGGMRVALLTAFLASSLGCAAPAAQEGAPDSPAEPARLAGTRSEAWRTTVKPYVWATGLDGYVKPGDLPRTAIDLCFDEVLEDLSFALMLGMDVDIADGGFKYDVTMSGPIVGLLWGI